MSKKIGIQGWNPADGREKEGDQNRPEIAFSRYKRRRERRRRRMLSLTHRQEGR